MIEACEFVLAAENDYYCTTHKVYFKNDSDCPYKHIAELEQQLAALREAALAEVARQRHQYAILRQELPPTTAALAALLQGEKG